MIVGGNRTQILIIPHRNRWGNLELIQLFLDIAPKKAGIFRQEAFCVRQVRKVRILIRLQINNAVRPNLSLLGYIFNPELSGKSRLL